MPYDETWALANVKRPEHRMLLRSIILADEALSAADFVQVLTPAAIFRFGASTAIVGRIAVERFVAGFFTTIRSMRHDVDHVWEEAGTLTYEARVTYGSLDGAILSLPYVNVLRLDGPLVRDYRIYIDPTPMASAR